jgi:hypothetical protein
MFTESKVNPIPTVTNPSTEAAVATIEDYVQRIQTSWQRHTSSVFDVAAACHDANDRLSPKEKQKLLGSALPFGKATFVKLAKIGGDERLVPIAAKLPSNFSIIYEIALLSDEQLEKAVGSEVIHPKVRRAEIVALRKATEDTEKANNKTPAAQPSAKELKAGGRYELKVPESAGEDDCKRITQALSKLCAKFKIEVSPVEEFGPVPEKGPVSAPPSGTPGSPVNHTSKKSKGSASIGSVS